MQTFLPYSNFLKSAQVLDSKRLGKQRVECMQLINILEGKQITKGWKSHPALKMWEGYLDALKEYANTCIKEWISRGYKNTMKLYEVSSSYEYPWWLGNEDFHRAMRSRLIAKNRDFYILQFPEDENFNEGKYFWPVNETKTFRII
jgi:hypothetical protein